MPNKVEHQDVVQRVKKGKETDVIDHGMLNIPITCIVSFMYVITTESKFMSSA